MPARGIDIRADSDRLVFRALLTDGAGNPLTSGTTELRLYELQDDGTLKVYDFADNTFKTTTPTDDEQTMAHQTVKDDAGADRDTGLWTLALATLTGFTRGRVYFAEVHHASAAPTRQVREFQCGGVEGDQVGYGDKQEIDRAAKTAKIYEEDGVTLKATLTHSGSGDVVTRQRQ